MTYSAGQKKLESIDSNVREKALEKNKKMTTRKQTYACACTHAYGKHTAREQQKDSRSVSMVATELLVFLLH